MTTTDASMRELGLYIHIPFCKQKCLYCDFCSFAGRDTEAFGEYASALCREIDGRAEDCRNYTVNTVYFGGGTPTLMPLRELERVIDGIFSRYSVAKDCEISCECNPATADAEYLRGLRSLGFNRLSIGLQSSNERELRALGRIHSFADFADTYRDARRVGFDNVSADLMYGIPEQSAESFRHTLESLAALSPEHISAYGLKIEDSTPFGKMRESLVLPDEDTEYDMYMSAAEYLARSGYGKYEISNFARSGYESRHNIKYWRCEPYLGFGVSAHSYFCGERFANSRDIDAYISGADITEQRRRISAEEMAAEFVMLGMRMSAGVSRAEYAERFSESFDGRYLAPLGKYIDTGYVISEGDRVRFSDKGFFVSNYILSDILEF